MKRAVLLLGALLVGLCLFVFVLWLGPGIRYVTADGAEVVIRRAMTTVSYPHGNGPISSIMVDDTEGRILVTVEGCTKTGP